MGECTSHKYTSYGLTTTAKVKQKVPSEISQQLISVDAGVIKMLHIPTIFLADGRMPMGYSAMSLVLHQKKLRDN